MNLHLLSLITLVAAVVPVAAQRKAEAPVSLTHVRNSFVLTVHAPYEDAAPLFGPSGERGWAGPRWDPRFLYPQPAEDVEGAVFTVQHGEHKSVWVNTVYDLDAHYFQYVYFIPDVVVTVIDVNFEPLESGNTQVHVVYTRTALNAAANETVEALGESDAKSGKQWEQAVNAYLESRRHP
jgi:hypothetical protein